MMYIVNIHQRHHIPIRIDKNMILLGIQVQRIYLVYTWYMSRINIYLVYTWYIPWFQYLGFQTRMARAAAAGSSHSTSPSLRPNDDSEKICQTYFEIYLIYDTVCHIPGISRNMYDILHNCSYPRYIPRISNFYRFQMTVTVTGRQGISDGVRAWASDGPSHLPARTYRGRLSVTTRIDH